MAAEFALEAGDTPAAARWTLAAADRLALPSLAEQAARLALSAGDMPLFERAMSRWGVLAPDSADRDGLRLVGALRAGRTTDALLAATRLLATESGVASVVRSLSPPQFDGGLTARAVLRGLLDSPPPPRLDPWLAMLGVARRLGDVDLAAEWTGAILQRFPDDPRAAMLEVERLSASGQRDLARALVRRILSDEGLDAETRRIAAEALAVLGDPMGASRALAILPPDVRLLTLRAAWLLQAGDVDGLLVLRDNALQLHATSPGAPLALLVGQLSERLLDWSTAESWYRTQLAGPMDEQARLRLAVVLARQGRDVEALGVFHALQNDEAADGESRRDAWRGEADFHEGRRRTAEAEAALRRGLAILEDDPLLRVALAGVLQRRGDVPGAEAQLRYVVARDPRHADAQRALGLLLLGVRRYAEAEPSLAAAFGAQPRAALAAAWGEALWLMDRAADARMAWSRGAALDPDDPVLLDTRRRLEGQP